MLFFLKIYSNIGRFDFRNKTDGLVYHGTEGIQIFCEVHTKRWYVHFYFENMKTKFLAATTKAHRKCDAYTLRRSFFKLLAWSKFFPEFIPWWLPMGWCGIFLTSRILSNVWRFVVDQHNLWCSCVDGNLILWRIHTVLQASAQVTPSLRESMNLSHLEASHLLQT